MGGSVLTLTRTQAVLARSNFITSIIVSSNSITSISVSSNFISITSIIMAPSPLAVKRRREADKPPIVGIPSRNTGEGKEKKKNSESKFLNLIYMVLGFLWYTLTG